MRLAEVEYGDFLNAEGAKVSQRAQKKSKKKNTKLKKKREFFQKRHQLLEKYSFLVLLLSPLFCALCETFAFSAFKNSPFPPP
jgi:cytoskeletal protein RodZ